jgi:hypothetical protein
VTALAGWETTDRPDGSRQSVLVERAVVESSDAGARRLGIVYWGAVHDLTRGVVRARWSGGGGTLRLLGIPLLRFGPPLLVHDEAVECRYEIGGGVLALRPGGSVTLAQRPVDGGQELSVTVAGYSPRLGALYTRAQRPFHVAVSRRYFELLARERTA